MRNVHMDERIAGASMWPEICCALTYPWFMVGRVASKLQLPYAGAFAAAAFLLALPGYLAVLYAEATLERSNSVALSVLAPLGTVGLIGLVAWLRGRVRQTASIPGELKDDVVASLPCCPPCCGYQRELASMDRQLSPPPMTLQERARLAGIRRHEWTSGICGCSWGWEGDLPQFGCAVSCPFFVQYRVLHRLGRSSLPVLAGVFGLQLFPYLLLVISEGPARGSIALYIFARAMLFFNVASIAATMVLRSWVRRHYGIAGTPTDDACLSTLCPACTLAQMERETSLAPAQEGLAAEVAGAGKDGVGEESALSPASVSYAGAV